jgi:hypothetical protein
MTMRWNWLRGGRALEWRYGIGRMKRKAIRPLLGRGRVAFEELPEPVQVGREFGAAIEQTLRDFDASERIAARIEAILTPEERQRRNAIMGVE